MPDDVVARLERLAARDGTSVSALAIRELSDVSRRADNADLLAGLPDPGVDVAAIGGDIEAERIRR